MECLTDFSELITPGAGCEIPITAERGISLEQLMRIARFILNHASPDGTVIEGKAAGKSGRPLFDQEADSGEEFADEDEDGGASHEKELTVSEKGHSAEQVTVHTINLYHLVELLVKPATASRACSYVELVAFSAWEQRPEWFVSHWWGEPILYFVSCLQQYAKVRGGRSVFWVCAYANSQHDLASSIGTDPSQTSFRQALAMSLGTVMVLDMKATPFWRVWCAYEMEVTLCCPDKQLDLVTFVPTWLKQARRRRMPHFRDGSLVVDGAFQMISDGLVPEDCMLSARDIAMNKSPWTLKVQREKNFPIDILRRGMNVSIQHARSSNPEDKVRILNTIAGAKNLDKIPAKDHPSYHRVNATLRLRFAMTMLHRAVMMGDKDVFEKILVSLANETEQHDRVFDFPSCEELTDSIVTQIVEHLPAHTRHLSFNMPRCQSLTSAALKSLGEHLGRLQALEELSVTVAGCESLGDEGLTALGEGLGKAGKKLKSLTLDLSWCPGIQEAGLLALASALRHRVGLKELTILVPRGPSSYKYHVSDAAYAELAASIGGLADLQSLQFHVAHQDTWDRTLMGVARCIGALPALRSLQLIVEGCVYSMSLDALGASLGRLTKLTNLCLDFRGGFWKAQQEQLEIAPADEKGNQPPQQKQPADPGLMSLAKGVQQLRELIELELSLDDFDTFGDAEACALATAIRKVKSLQELRFSLAGAALQDAGAQALASAIAKHSRLQSLCVQFSNCEGLGDASAEAMARSLFSLEDLAELKLCFTGTSIGNYGVRALSHNMTHMEGLTDLNLLLTHLPTIDDMAIADLGHCLLEFAQLRMLTVDVTETGTTAGAVESLRELLAGMCSLTEEGARWTEVGSGNRLAFLPKRADEVGAVAGSKAEDGSAKTMPDQGVAKGKAGSKGKGKGDANNTGFETIPDERRAELEERVNAYVNGTEKAPLEFRPDELSPNERRLIHMMIEDVKGFITQSFGEGDGRYLVIFRDKGKLGRSVTANLDRVIATPGVEKRQRGPSDLEGAALLKVVEEAVAGKAMDSEVQLNDDGKAAQNTTMTTAAKRKLRKMRAKARRMNI